MLVRYPSVDAYMTEVNEKWRPYIGDRDTSASWSDNVAPVDAATYAVKGHPGMTTKATEAINKVMAKQVAPGRRNRYSPSFAGSRVSVPDYLGGNPMSMRRKQLVEMQCQSARIYVSLVCSAGTPAASMLTRGSTILAFLEYLQMCNVAIELYLLAETDGSDADGETLQLIKVESNPLDLSTASFAIAHPAFTRHITYRHAVVLNGFTGGWPMSYMFGSSNERYYTTLRTKLEMQPDDIHIRPAEYNSDIITSPETWLTKNIQQLGLAA